MLRRHPGHVAARGCREGHGLGGVPGENEEGRPVARGGVLSAAKAQSAHGHNGPWVDCRPAQSAAGMRRAQGTAAACSRFNTAALTGV